MMDFQMTGEWIVGTAFCYLVAILIAVWIRSLYRPRYRYEQSYYETIQFRVRHRWYVGLWQGLATFTILCAVGNAIIYGASHSYGTPRQNSYDAAATFGFESGKSYPMALGSRMGGSSTEVSGYRSSFTVREKSGSTLSLGFNNEGRSYILEVPVSKTTFVVDESLQPSMRLYLYSTDYGVKRVAYKSPCQVVVESGVLACNRTIEYETWLSDDQVRQGLGDVVQNCFGSAEIVLSQEMYDSILGKK